MLDPVWKICEKNAEELFKEGDKKEALEMINISISSAARANRNINITSLISLHHKISASLTEPDQKYLKEGETFKLEDYQEKLKEDEKQTKKILLDNQLLPTLFFLREKKITEDRKKSSGAHIPDPGPDKVKKQKKTKESWTWTAHLFNMLAKNPGGKKYSKNSNFSMHICP